MISVNALNIKGSILQNSHRCLPVTSLIFARPRHHHSSAILWTTKSKLNPIMKQMPMTNRTRSVEDRPLHQKEETLIITEIMDIYTSNFFCQTLIPRFLPEAGNADLCIYAQHRIKLYNIIPLKDTILQ